MERYEKGFWFALGFITCILMLMFCSPSSSSYDEFYKEAERIQQHYDSVYSVR